MSPVISIITLTYNHERCMEAFINSVLSQTNHNWEMIIINDGSTDATTSVANRVLCLPVFKSLSIRDVKKISKIINNKMDAD